MKDATSKTTSRVNRVGEIYEPFKYRLPERPLPPLREDEVLIGVRASAICGSDLHIARGLHPRAPLPVTVGHEFSGDVVETGARVDNVHIGSRVTVEPCITCGECDACRHGHYNYCERLSFTYRNGDGAMADYVIVKKEHVFPLPDCLSYETGALIEPLAVASHAVQRAGIRLGESVLVIGDGMIGIMIAAMCKKCGASSVILSGHHPNRLELAKEFGADFTILSGHESPEETVLALTSQKGVDKSFECVGKEDCLAQAVSLLKKGGTATIAGIYEKPMPALAVGRILSHELTLLGTQGYCFDFPIALEAARELPLEKCITHSFPLSLLEDAFQTALNPSSGAIKVIVKP